MLIRGQRTIAELAARHKLHPNLITQWERQPIEKLAKAFDDKGIEVQASLDAEITELLARIGQLVVERDLWPKPSIAEPGPEEDDDRSRPHLSARVYGLAAESNEAADASANDQDASATRQEARGHSAADRLQTRMSCMIVTPTPPPTATEPWTLIGESTNDSFEPPKSTFTPRPRPMAISPDAPA